MSDERWIKITEDERWAQECMVDALYQGLVEPALADTAVMRAFDATEGQRVETIRWCDEHNAEESLGRPGECWKFYFSRVDSPCHVIEEATLILPPEAAS